MHLAGILSGGSPVHLGELGCVYGGAEIPGPAQKAQKFSARHLRQRTRAKRAVACLKALLVDHREVLEVIPDQLVENGLLRVSRSVERRSLPDHRLLDCLLGHGRKGVARGRPGARRKA